MAQPLISVIIPCYKQAHFLSRAVRSCLEGGGGSVEIIVVDDGSPDDVSKAVAPFGAAVRMIQKLNGGLSSARNEGLRSANGHFVKFLDADDWVLPGSLSRQASILRGASNAILVTGYRLEFEDPRRLPEEYLPSFGRWDAALARENVAPVHAYMLPLEVARRVGEFDETLKTHEDYDYWCRASPLGVDVITLHSVDCVYYQHSTSMRHSENRMIEGGLLVWKRFAMQCTRRPPQLQVTIELLRKCAALLSQHPQDHELKQIAKMLLDAAKSLCGKISVNDSLQIARSTAEILLLCPDPMVSEGERVLDLTLANISHFSSELERHSVQRAVFDVGLILLQSGNRNLGRSFLRRSEAIGSTYGINYSYLARFQTVLCSILPSPVAVACFFFAESLMKSYWKILGRLFHKVLCNK